MASETERDLRHQLAAAKVEVYEPMIELLRKMLDTAKTNKPQNDRQLMETLSKFVAWLQVYGADNAIVAYHKFMQAAFHSAPGEVLMYYYAAFLVAVRRDLGHPDTQVGRMDLLGMRINDVWEVWGETANLSERDLLAQVSWNPPWPDEYGQHAKALGR